MSCDWNDSMYIKINCIVMYVLTIFFRLIDVYWVVSDWYMCVVIVIDFLCGINNMLCGVLLYSYANESEWEREILLFKLTFMHAGYNIFQWQIYTNSKPYAM